MVEGGLLVEKTQVKLTEVLLMQHVGLQKVLLQQDLQKSVKFN